jgi:hypothetical protein
LKDNDQIKREPNNIDVILRRSMGIKESKYEFPRDVGAKSRYGHTISLIPKTQSDDQYIYRGPKDSGSDL